jgi:UTP:GlnB (protein PII) uridylyltransferase
MCPDHEAFAASMAASYHEAFEDGDVAAHAAIASRREGSMTRVEIWKDLPERFVAICIVADDRPGLLSQISAALVAEQIDVVSAHAYCRTRRDGVEEAVDLLWIRRVARANGRVMPRLPSRRRPTHAFGTLTP